MTSTRLLNALSKALVLFAGFTAGPSALAALVPVVNAGFEDISGEVTQGVFTFGPLLGWDLYDPTSSTGSSDDGITDGGAGNQYFIGTLTPPPGTNPGPFENFPQGAPEGERVAIAFDFAGNDVANGGTEYGLQQTLSATLQANTTYTLTVEIGNIASGMSNGNFFNLTGFPGYRVDLLAGGEVLESDDNTLATNGNTIPDGEFALSTVSFTTGVNHDLLGEALGIRLVNLNVIDLADPTADLEVDFDDVRLDAAVVPLPAMVYVLALCFAGLGICRRYRRES